MKKEQNGLVIITYNVIRRNMILIGIFLLAIGIAICSTTYLAEYVVDNMKSITETKALQLEMIMKINVHISELVSTLMSAVLLLQIVIDWYITANESKLESFEGSVEERNKLVTEYWNSNFISKLAYISVVSRFRKKNEEEYYKRTVESSNFKAWYTWKDKGGRYWIIYITFVLLLIVFPLAYELYLLLL